MMTVGTIIQARISSTRLPGKTLAEIMGKPMLWHLVQRAAKSSFLNKIVIATTVNPKDDCIVKFAEFYSIPFFRGSEEDVLDRFYRTAKFFNLDVIVRITPDCPLFDPEITDRVIQLFVKEKADYASNVHPPTYPDGLDTEVFSFKVLEKTWKEANKLSEREHVTPFIWNNPGIFKLVNLENDRDLSCLRWTVDEKKDFEFVHEIYKKLYKQGEIFLMKDVLELLEKYPELMKINQGIGRNMGFVKSVREDKIFLHNGGK